MAKSKTGRKRVFTPDIIAILVEAFKAGLSNADACTAAGVSEAAFYDWMKSGDERKSPVFSEFSETIKKAKLEYKKSLLRKMLDASTQKQVIIEEKRRYDADGNLLSREVIQKAAPPPWQPIAWLLERRYRDEFGRFDRLSVDSRSEVSGELKVKDERELVKQLSQDELALLIGIQDRLGADDVTLQ